MSVTIQTFVNVQYNSNTYLITNDLQDPSCYLIDIGNAQDVLNALKKHQYIKAIFLTHAHYDHIAGVNEIASTFPNCKIYGSAYTIEALADSKINLSFYHWTPVIYNGNNTIILEDEETLELFDTVALKVIATPGHNAGSFTFKIGQAIFTGDSLIPQIPVVTKLKSGNKFQAEQSISRIRSRCMPFDLIYPGHGKQIHSSKVDWDFYLL
jgi:hydroxyacylglutathione hydrolase